MTPSAPWDRPPALEQKLAVLEALWREKQNPIYVWRAIGFCLLAHNEKIELLGPFQFPNWVLLYLLRATTKAMSLVRTDPVPSNDEAGRDILKVLGFAAQGRQVFREYMDDTKMLVLAELADDVKNQGGSLSELSERMAECLEPGLLPVRPRPAKEAEADPRPIKRLIARGRRLRERIKRAKAKEPQLHH